jgi:hypothetical protein
MGRAAAALEDQFHNQMAQSRECVILQRTFVNRLRATAVVNGRRECHYLGTPISETPMTVVDVQNPLFIKPEHLTHHPGVDRNLIQSQQKRTHNLMPSDFKHSPALAHRFRFLR